VSGPALPLRPDGQRFHLTRQTVQRDDHQLEGWAHISVVLPRGDLPANCGQRIRVYEVGDLAPEQLVSRVGPYLAHERLVDVDVAAGGVNADGDRAVLDQPSILLFGRVGRRRLMSALLRAINTF
jgi:hypothetical protein